MTISSTDIANRALQLVGARTTVTSLAEQTNEAIQANIAYNAVLSWCFGLLNWNFARNTAALARAKSVVGGIPSPWTAASPAPPWMYQYTLPGDFVRAIYLTNSEANGVTNYLGEPKRYVMAYDSGSTQEVLLTNEAVPVLVYTALVTSVPIWPWYFERLMVAALAEAISYALTGNLGLTEALAERVKNQIVVAEEANRTEGLLVSDNTPEWVQAIGINYPLRRNRPETPVGQTQERKGRGNDNGN